MAGTETVALAERLRHLLDGDPRITERAMFGGIAFMLNGNMLICAGSTGRLMVYVGKPGNEQALERPGAHQMIHGGSPKTGFIWVDPEEIEADQTLTNWIDLAESFVKTKPPK